MKTCKDCGATNPDEGIYCMKCGHRLITPSNTEYIGNFKRSCYHIIKDFSRYFAIYSCIFFIISLIALFNYRVETRINDETCTIFIQDKMTDYYRSSIMYDYSIGKAVSLAKNRYKSNVIQGCEFYGFILLLSLGLFYMTNKQLKKELAPS